MNWSKPLRLHLSVLVVGLLLCISTPLIWIAFSQGREAAILAGEKQMRQMSLRLVEGYKNALEGGYEAVVLASTLPQLSSPPMSEVESKEGFFIEVLRNVPNATSIYGGYPDGSYLQAINATDTPVRVALAAPDGTAFAIRTIAHRQGADVISTLRFLDKQALLLEERNFEYSTFDPRERPWYRTAVQSGAPVSVGPYVTGTLKVPTLTIAVPTKDDGRAVVGINIHLKTISRLLNAQEISARARSYILNEDDSLVAHSDTATMNKIFDTWSEHSPGDGAEAKDIDPSIETVVQVRNSPNYVSGGMTRFDLDGEDYLAQVAPVTVAGLFKGSSAAIIVPMEDLVREANRQLAHNLALAAVFVTAGIAASILLSRIISRKLYQLADEARRIGDLDFAGKPASHSFISEINTLASALTAARRAISQFALYVPREVVRRIVDPAGPDVARAKRQTVSVLFTDIRDFTTISEHHSPEDVVEILSTYFERLNDLAERHNGTVVQYLGDSIFVMWNAPIRDTRHVEHACRCALAMQSAIERLNEDNREKNRPELSTRFGLHTGQAVVGSFGAITRRQYTAMGDTINVASRLEGLNKEFSTSILVSEAVKAAVSDQFAFRPIGPVKVKGRDEKVEVLELIGELGPDHSLVKEATDDQY